MNNIIHTKRFGKVNVSAIVANEKTGETFAVIKYRMAEDEFVTTNLGRKILVDRKMVTKTEKLSTVLSKGDKFNKYVGVALAFVGLDYKSKNAFRKAKNVGGYITNEAAALMMSYEAFGGKEAFEKYVDEHAIVIEKK